MLSENPYIYVEESDKNVQDKHARMRKMIYFRYYLYLDQHYMQPVY